MLYATDISIQVVHYNSLGPELFALSHRQVVILGPGPGHVNDYLTKLAPFLDLISKRPNILVLGICLGHQLLLSRLGLELKRAQVPVHGQSLEVECLDGQVRMVQFYNSLSVHGDLKGYTLIKNLSGEIMTAKGPQLISYQFHPESVGTSYPNYFFGPVRDFLYN